MKRMNETEVREEIFSKEVFASTFVKADDNIKQLFINLARDSSIYSCNTEGYVKKMTRTGYRLEKPYIVGRRRQNYCMFTIFSNQIIIDIRTDGTPISSDALTLINKGDCFNGGFEWYEFKISNDSDLVEAIRLIEYCYKI